MKIALVGNDYHAQFPVKSYGGIESCVENLAWGLYRRGLDFFCVVPQRETPESYPFEVVDVPVKPAVAASGKPYPFINAVKEVVLDRKPDVVWSQSHWSGLGLSRIDIPVVCTFHDSCLKQEGWMIKEDNLLYRFISQFQYDNWVKEPWEADCSYQVYTGLADEEYEFCGDRDDYFLWVGGFNWGWEAKGLPVFIELARLNPEKCFVAYGAGSERIAELASQHAKEIPNFDFKGPLHRGEEHRTAFKKTRAYIMPSRIPDTFPRTVLESLSKGTPVIGSANGSLPEMIGDCGISSNDPNTLNQGLNIAFDYQKIFEKSKKFHIDEEINGLLEIAP